MNTVGEHVFNCDFLLPLYYPTPRWWNRTIATNI